MNKNIFMIGGQVTGDSFIGRKRLLKWFREKFISSGTSTNLSIVGLPRLGKSSTIANAFSQNAENIIYINLNLGIYLNYYEIWQDICEKIRAKIKINEEQQTWFDSVKSNPIEWIYFQRNIKEIFQWISEQNVRIILVLDEFDNASVLFNQDNRGTSRFELFREILSAPPYKDSVSGITISRKTLKSIQGNCALSSTFHGVFDRYNFSGFDEEDMNEYFNVFSEEYGFTLNDSQKSRIRYYADNVPYLLSILGHYIIQSYQAEQPIDIDLIFEEKCVAIHEYYDDIIDHLKREGDLERIIPFIYGPKIGVSKFDKNELISLGYIKNKGENFICISEYFNDYIRVGRSLSIDIWKNIFTFEKKMKGLIEREFSRIVVHYQAYGNNIDKVYEDIINKSESFNVYRDDRTNGNEPNPRISQLRKFQRNERNIFKCKKSLLSVMSLQDALYIVRECWSDVFSPYFGNDLYEDWKDKFEKCVRARNPIAHAHEEYLDDLEIKEIDIFCQQIFSKLDETIPRITPLPTPWDVIARANSTRQTSFLGGISSTARAESASSFSFHTSQCVETVSSTSGNSQIENLDPYRLIEKELVVTAYEVHATKKNKRNLRCSDGTDVKIIITSNFLADYSVDELGQKAVAHAKARVLVKSYNNNLYEAALIEWL